MHQLAGHVNIFVSLESRESRSKYLSFHLLWVGGRGSGLAALLPRAIWGAPLMLAGLLKPRPGYGSSRVLSVNYKNSRTDDYFHSPWRELLTSVMRSEDWETEYKLNIDIPTLARGGPESVLDLTLENSGKRYCWKVEVFLTVGQRVCLSLPVSGDVKALWTESLPTPYLCLSLSDCSVEGRQTHSLSLSLPPFYDH